MSSDRFARIETLYHAARARAPEERAVYLAEACGTDTDLRREVESLLAQQGAGALTSVVARPALASGTVIGVYRIVERIGAGGMGEVYRAHDTKLDRDVAIKVLPAALANDRDRLTRLEREARLLAALNHPNIAHVYGLEESNGTRALVMELAEGETLADRLTRGAIPIREAVPIARQIADALASAHERGVVHRDLKPANIKLRPDGTAKVLDFGLAKAMDSVGGSATTEDGVILGTAAYVSPEQASGKPVDRRTDLWAFGAVLMEMLTGRRVFDGESTAHVLSSVLKTDPDWSAVPADTPAAVRRLLRRCLVKDPTRRLDSAAAARLELDDDSSEAPAPPGSSRAAKAWMAVALVSVTGALVFAGLYLRSPEGVASLTETPLTSYDEGYQGQPTLSPDGTQFAFVWNRRPTDPLQLYVRPITGGTPVQLTSTLGTFANSPAWSPDGQTIAFIRGTVGRTPESGLAAIGDLTVMPALGGPERIICKARFSRLAWSPDGSLLYFAAPFEQTGAIFVVPERGGTSERVTDPPRNTFGDFDPAVSADGRHLVFVRVVADFNADLFVSRLKDGKADGAAYGLTHDHRPTSSPLWLPDGTSIVYTTVKGSDRFNLRGIYRVSSSGGTPSRLSLSAGEYAETLALQERRSADLRTGVSGLQHVPRAAAARRSGRGSGTGDEVRIVEPRGRVADVLAGRHAPGIRIESQRNAVDFCGGRRRFERDSIDQLYPRHRRESEMVTGW